ncbi:MAG: C69 family dipeptidase [Desulfobulbaceae bacterium]|nr:C69 family dipeptidase [Desulfobulbaceae bacterium]
MKKHVVFPAVVLLTLALSTPAFNCTTTLTGKDASADGSVMVSHTDDGLGDPRVVFVPAMDHPEGALRPVFYESAAMGYLPEWGGSQTHRLVTDGRGPGYRNPDEPASVPLGFIPQVSHTFAYIDANYGIMNEHQVSIGECTDKAKVHPLPEPGKRIFYSAELSRVALERSTTAREAIAVMGRLIDTYGYYGTGETLLVADPNEGWVFEMAGYDLNGTDGVWVAQRVPDNGFFVAANQFRIREIREGADDMIFSANIFDAARTNGWWRPEDGPLDWARVYGDGEFHHPYYSLRRVWRAQSLVASSLDLPAWVDGPFTRSYPFAVVPDQKLSVQDVMAVHRDNYEGTEFDLTTGLAAGPFDNPNRFEGGAEATMDKQGRMTTLNGAFERPLNIYRCAYVYVNQSRSWLPDPIGGVSWIGLDRPATSVLLPFYAGGLGLPRSLEMADVLRVDRGSMWTAFNYVANYAMLKYSYMIKDIRAEQGRFEARGFGGRQEVEARSLALRQSGDEQGARRLLTEDSAALADELLAAWWQLADHLYITYNDGYINTKEMIAQPVFYPAWWLEAVGYQNGPQSYEKPATK